jgi:hypothetical protein
MHRSSRFLLAGLLAAACVEDVNAPGQCPDYCPGGQITVIDTILRTVIAGDSAFRGYVTPAEAASLLVADLPGIIDSRGIFYTVAQQARIAYSISDTSTGGIIAVDSAYLKLLIVRRDTAAHNLTLRLYRLPFTLDSSTTFGAVAPFFTDSLLRTVNVDSLIATANKKDTVTGDSVRVDSISRRIDVIIRLDSAQARYVAADTGRLGFGLRVSADSLASIAIGAKEAQANVDPQLIRFVRLDSTGLVNGVKRTLTARTAQFDSYVFAPAAPALDSTLAVGGIPTARSFLRVALPAAIRDSSQIIRATLLLVPATAAQGTPIDSFFVIAHGVDADFGGKSPIAVDSARKGSAVVRIGQTDTVRIDLTRLVRIWSFDSTAVTGVMLRVVPVTGLVGEGSTLAEIRFQPSGHTTLRPALHVTYVRRFPFGVP